MAATFKSFMSSIVFHGNKKYNTHNMVFLITHIIIHTINLSGIAILICIRF